MQSRTEPPSYQPPSYSSQQQRRKEELGGGAGTGAAESASLGCGAAANQAGGSVCDTGAPAMTCTTAVAGDAAAGGQARDGNSVAAATRGRGGRGEHRPYGTAGGGAAFTAEPTEPATLQHHAHHLQQQHHHQQPWGPEQHYAAPPSQAVSQMPNIANSAAPANANAMMASILQDGSLLNGLVPSASSAEKDSAALLHAHNQHRGGGGGGSYGDGARSHGRGYHRGGALGCRGSGRLKKEERLHAAAADGTQQPPSTSSQGAEQHAQTGVVSTGVVGSRGGHHNTTHTSASSGGGGGRHGGHGDTLQQSTNTKGSAGHAHPHNQHQMVPSHHAATSQQQQQVPPLYELHMHHEHWLEMTRLDTAVPSSASSFFSFSQFGNVASLLNAVAPRVPSVYAPNHVGAGKKLGPVYVMQDLWQCFDVPFGVTVPLQDACVNPFKGPEPNVYYTPILSALSVTYCPHPFGTEPDDAQHEDDANSRALPSDDEGLAEEVVVDDVEGEAQARDASSHATTPNKSSSSHRASGRKSAQTASSSTTGPQRSSQSSAQPQPQPQHIVWSATEKPEQRLPLYDQILALAEEGRYPQLMTARNIDFDCRSWVAVLWQPIHCHNHTLQHSCGSFIAFYMIRPPRQLFHRKVLRRDLVRHAQTPEGVAMMNRDVESVVFRCDTDAIAGANLWGQHSAVAGLGSGGSVASTDGVRTAATPTKAKAPPASSGYTPTGSGVAETTPTDAAGATAAGGDVNDETASSVCFGGGKSTSSVVSSGSRKSASGGPIYSTVPVFAMVPGRMRADIWFRLLRATSDHLTVSAPLFLIATAAQLMHGEEERAQMMPPPGSATATKAAGGNGLLGVTDVSADGASAASLGSPVVPSVSSSSAFPSGHRRVNSTTEQASVASEANTGSPVRPSMPTLRGPHPSSAGGRVPVQGGVDFLPGGVVPDVRHFLKHERSLREFFNYYSH